MADLRPQFNEEVVAANHPTKADVTNRAWDIEHAEDGTHNTSKDVDSFGGLAAAVAIWNADGGDITLQVATTQTSLSANLTANSNISLICLMQGLIPIDAARTLTINGPFEGIGQVFSGAGSVSGLSFAYAEWFGFSTSATAANNAVYITAALAASKVVKIGTAGTYSCDPFTISTVQTTLKGAGYFGGGVILSYPGATSFITLDANRCRIEDLWLNGPDAIDGNGDIAIDIQNGKWKNVIKDVAIWKFDTGVKDDGYDNVIKETQIYDFGAVGVEFAGGANGELDDVTISDSANSGICISVTGNLNHLLCKKVVFGKSDVGFAVGGSCKTVTLIDPHFENVVTREISYSDATAKMIIIGGRMDGTIRAGTSGTNSTDFTLIGVYAAGIVAITNDTYSIWTFSNCVGIGGADVGGTAIELDRLDLDENGNLIINGDFTASGFIRSDSVVTSNTRTVRYSRRITGIANNSTVNIFKATCTIITISGWITVSAYRTTEASSHIYQVHSDPAGVTITEIGVGRNRNATIALTAAVAGNDLTFTVDTTASDWAGDDIIATVTADLTSGGGPISYTDL